MAVSNVEKSNVSGTIGYSDGTGTPVTLTSSFERGDFKLSGLRPELNEANPVARRGKHLGLVHGNRVYPTVSFSAWVTQFAESVAPGNDVDFLLFKDAYSANISTGGAGTPKTIDIDYTIEGTDFGDSADHTFTLTDVHIDSVDYTESPEGLYIEFTGTVYGPITGDLGISEIA